MVKVGVLALQGDVREHVALLDSVGAEAVEVRRPDQLDDIDALVIPGGESTTRNERNTSRQSTSDRPSRDAGRRRGRSKG